MITPRFLPGMLMGAALAAAVLAGCGAKVTVDAPSGTGGATSTSSVSVSGTGGAGGCGGETFGCLQFCGSDFFPANAECVGGAWVCPAGTVDPATCKLPTCCSVDQDCGDAVFVPCVKGVCKVPMPGGCWSDEECGLMALCNGAFVCPCTADCKQPDHPGVCVAPP